MLQQVSKKCKFQEFVVSVIEYTWANNSFSSRKAFQIIQLKWMPTSMDFLKLNTDGSSKGNPRKSGISRVVSVGHWIIGFYSAIQVAINTKAELHALLRGLQIACTLKVTKLEVNLDSEVVINLLNNNQHLQYSNMQILQYNSWRCLEFHKHFKRRIMWLIHFTKKGASYLRDKVLLYLPLPLLCTIFLLEIIRALVTPVLSHLRCSAAYLLCLYFCLYFMH